MPENKKAAGLDPKAIAAELAGLMAAPADYELDRSPSRRQAAQALDNLGTKAGAELNILARTLPGLAAHAIMAEILAEYRVAINAVLFPPVKDEPAEEGGQ